MTTDDVILLDRWIVEEGRSRDLGFDPPADLVERGLIECTGGHAWRLSQLGWQEFEVLLRKERAIVTKVAMFS